MMFLKIAVAEKKVDAGIADVTYGNAKIGEFGLRSTGVVFNPLNYYFTVTKGRNQVLLLLLDKYLAEWENQEKSVLNQAKTKWLHGPPGTVKVIPRWLINALIIFGVAILVAFSFIVLLRQQVKKATNKIIQRDNALRESEERYRTLVEKANEAILIAQDNKIAFANDKLEDILALPIGEIIGKAFVDFIHPEDKNLVFERYKKRLAGENVPDAYDFRVISSVEETRWLCLSARKIQWNERPATLNMLTDITERKKAEQALIDSEEHYRGIIENVIDAYYRTDIDGNIIMFSPSGLSIFGYDSLDEILGKNVATDLYLNPEEREKVLSELNKTGLVRDYEVVLKRKDGSTIPISANSRYYHDEGGHILGVEGFFKDISEHKLAEEALGKSEEKFRLIFDASPVGIGITTLDGHLLDANPATIKFTGYSIEELKTINARDTYMHPGDRDLILKLATETGVVCDHEVELKRKDGSAYWALLNIDKMRIGNQDIFLSTHRDITDRKQAEESLRDSETKLQAIFDTVGTGIIIIDKDTQIIIDANPTAIEMTGLPKENIIGQICHSLVCPAQVGKCPVKDLGQNVDHSERKLLCAEGQQKDILKTVYPINIKGRDCYIESFIDVSDSKRAKDALIVSEEKYRRITENMSDIVSEIDAHGIFKYIGPAHKKIFGDNPEDIIGRSVFDRVHPDDRESVAADYVEGIRTKTVRDVEYRYQHKDGHYIWIRSSGHPLFDDAGEVVGMIVNSSDISERKRADVERAKLESQLFQSQKMEAIGTLAGGIAHDFNNILGAIIGYTEMAIDENQNKEYQEYLQETLKGAERAKDLVKQILTFSRQDDQDKKPLDIKILLKEAIKFLRSSIPTTIEIDQHLTNESCTILADHTQMHQIIMNLCTNAAHAMKQTGGKLKIELSTMELAEGDLSNNSELQPGHYIKLTIGDTGHGIDPDNIKRIFDPFFTTKTKDEGTGLGLSVVYGIVKSHDGVINVESKVDEGATFNVYLPRIIHEAVNIGNISGISIGGKEQILFVDDERTLVNLGTRMLSSLGYEVTGITSSLEALDLFATAPQRFDLVITDMTIPKMTGIVLSRKILKIRPDIPIIICSGIREPGMEEQAKSLGIKAYCMKPLTKKELARVVREVLDDREIPIS